MKFILLISVKMPTFVDILISMSRINTTSEFKSRNIFIFQYFSFYEQVKIHTQQKSLQAQGQSKLIPGTEVIKKFMLNSTEH